MRDLRPKFDKDGNVVSTGRVARRTASPCDHHGRRLIVALEPGDIIAFREERRRKWFRAVISRLYVTVVKWTVDAERTEKRKARKEARA